MKPPVKLEIGQWIDDRFGGHHEDIWHYFEPPPGMRLATLRDMYPGRQFLYQVQIGPDKGDYYTGFFAGNSIEPVREKIRRGLPVYVKD